MGLFTPIPKLHEMTKEKMVRIGGVSISAKKILTKNNEPMVFMKIEDTDGDVEAVVFPRVYRDKPELWVEGKAMVLSGRVQEKDGEPKFLVETGYELTPDNLDEVANAVDTFAKAQRAKWTEEAEAKAEVAKKSASGTQAGEPLPIVQTDPPQSPSNKPLPCICAHSFPKRSCSSSAQSSISIPVTIKYSLP